MTRALDLAGGCLGALALVVALVLRRSISVALDGTFHVRL